MGFLSRLLVPRGVRRAVHPGRAVKRAITPKPVKQLRRAASPLSNASYAVARTLNTKPRRRKASGPVYHHGNCPVNHRSLQAAQRCRNR